jgi:hypothetical protein
LDVHYVTKKINVQFRIIVMIASNTISVKFEISVDLKKQMDEFPNIDWAKIMEQKIKSTLEDLRFMHGFTAESTMTENDAIELGEELNKRMAKRYGVTR